MRVDKLAFGFVQKSAMLKRIRVVYLHSNLILERNMEVNDTQSKVNRSTEELIISYSCLACALIVAPFVLLRFSEGDYRLALIDTLIFIGLLVMGVVTWATGNVKLTRWLVSVYSMAAVIAVVYSKGAVLVYWFFPVVLLSFFISRLSHACWITGVGLAALSPIIFLEKSLNEAWTIISSIAMTSVVAFIFSYRTYRQRDLLAKIATIDHLTGVGNRRALSQSLRESSEIKKRRNEHISVILLDLDHFKEANDLYGHATGDDLLVRVCNLIRSNIRLTDRLYRYGGEEFVVVLRGSTVNEAFATAEKLRISIIEDDSLRDYGVTISLGVAELDAGESEEQWLERVDSALYESKRTGRNKTTLAPGNEKPVVT